MRGLRFGAALVAVVVGGGVAAAGSFYVAPDGKDRAVGSAAAPWRNLQRAADRVGPGDTVVVRPGHYRGFFLGEGGEPGRPIRFAAEPGVIVEGDARGATDGIALEGVGHVVIEGFTVTGATRAGIRAVQCHHVTLRGNRAIDNGRWGIFTGFCDDLLVEGNECALAGREHGIYLSNSGDRPVVRNNVLHHNRICGLHMNGDASMGGDGVISEALIEGNVIYENGAAGGSAINCDGVQRSVIRNNLLYGNHASGISLYRIDAAAGAIDNLVEYNTVVVAADGRWALNIQDGSTGNTARNNILIDLHPDKGAIDISPSSRDGFTSDYNAVTDRFTVDGEKVLDLAGWRAATGQDAHSLVATPEQLFAAGGYRLSLASPVVDRGAGDAPDTDLYGTRRPVGAAPDIGAEELCAGDCVQPRVVDRVRAAAAAGTAPPPRLPPRSPPSRGCAGCAAGDPGSSLALFLLVAGLLVGRRRARGLR